MDTRLRRGSFSWAEVPRLWIALPLVVVAAGPLLFLALRSISQDWLTALGGTVFVLSINIGLPIVIMVLREPRSPGAGRSDAARSE